MSSISTASSLTATYSVATMRLSSPKAASGDAVVPVSVPFASSQSSLPTGALAVCKQINGKTVVELIPTCDLLRYIFSAPLPEEPADVEQKKLAVTSSPKKRLRNSCDVVCRLCGHRMAETNLSNVWKLRRHLATHHLDALQQDFPVLAFGCPHAGCLCINVQESNVKNHFCLFAPSVPLDAEAKATQVDLKVEWFSPREYSDLLLRWGQQRAADKNFRKRTSGGAKAQKSPKFGRACRRVLPPLPAHLTDPMPRSKMAKLPGNPIIVGSTSDPLNPPVQALGACFTPKKDQQRRFKRQEAPLQSNSVPALSVAPALTVSDSSQVNLAADGSIAVGSVHTMPLVVAARGLDNNQTPKKRRRLETDAFVTEPALMGSIGNLFSEPASMQVENDAPNVDFASSPSWRSFSTTGFDTADEWSSQGYSQSSLDVEPCLLSSPFSPRPMLSLLDVGDSTMDLGLSALQQPIDRLDHHALEDNQSFSKQGASVDQYFYQG